MTSNEVKLTGITFAYSRPTRDYIFLVRKNGSWSCTVINERGAIVDIVSMSLRELIDPDAPPRIPVLVWEVFHSDFRKSNDAIHFVHIGRSEKLDKCPTIEQVADTQDNVNSDTTAPKFADDVQRVANHLGLGEPTYNPEGSVMFRKYISKQTWIDIWVWNVENNPHNLFDNKQNISLHLEGRRTKSGKKALLEMLDDLIETFPEMIVD